MRFSARKKKILIVIMGLLVILSLNFFQKEVKGFFYSFSAPIQKSLWGAGDRVSDFFEGIFRAENLKKEAEELKLKNQELLAENVSLQNLKKENQILREALEIGLEKDFKLELAEVIGKDIGQDSLLINKGLKNGISEGMPVITQQKTIVGRITEIYENFSRVRLISSKESSFDAEIIERDILGVVKGKGGLKIYLDLIPRQKELKEGDLVTSASLGGIFPQGLLIGLIEKVKQSDVSFYQQAEISPFFNVEEIENVFIILNF